MNSNQNDEMDKPIDITTKTQYNDADFWREKYIKLRMVERNLKHTIDEYWEKVDTYEKCIAFLSNEIKESRYEEETDRH